MTYGRSEGPFTAHSQLPTPPFPRVLLVEDNADARTMITDGLALAGCEVRSAGSGEEALALVRSDVAATAATSGQVPWMPDIMLVDIGLPGMDGYEFLRRVHREPGMADVPAFAVTGWGSEEDVRRGREAGFAGHFVKPVDMAALRRVLPGGG